MWDLIENKILIHYEIPALQIIFATDHTTTEKMGLQNAYFHSVNRQNPDASKNSVLAFTVTGKEDWSQIKTGCSDFFDQTNDIIKEKKTIRLTIPPHQEQEKAPICNKDPDDYLQDPQNICSQCFREVSNLELHNEIHHPETTFFCSHYTHGGETLFFNSKFEKLQHNRTFHPLSEETNSFKHSVSSIFPGILQKCSAIGIDKSHSSLKRDVSHLSFANFEEKTLPVQKEEFSVQRFTAV